MFVNRNTLIQSAPIKNMETQKQRYQGTSYGLAEAGYDLRIKQTIDFTHTFDGKKVTYVHTADEEIETFQGHFCIASAIEEFQMPKNLVGGVKDKSTWARRGLSVFNTVIEPGWNGFLTLELVYHGHEPLRIKAGQGIVQVLFGLLTDEGDYGDGKYQNQTDKPHEARS